MDYLIYPGSLWKLGMKSLIEGEYCVKDYEFSVKLMWTILKLAHMMIYM